MSDELYLERDGKGGMRPSRQSQSGVVQHFSWSKILQTLRESLLTIHENEWVDRISITKDGIKFYIEKV
jgi:hypothetical protein